MAEITLKIEGMSCQHCVMSVKKAVDNVKGVLSSDITVGSARIEYDDSVTGRDVLANAVQNAGYKVIN
jgi:copper chaperone